MAATTILVVPVLYEIRYANSPDKYFIEFVQAYNKWRIRKDSTNCGRIFSTYLMPIFSAEGTLSLVFLSLALARTPVYSTKPVLYDSIEVALYGWQNYINGEELSKK